MKPAVSTWLSTMNLYKMGCRFVLISLLVQVQTALLLETQQDQLNNKQLTDSTGTLAYLPDQIVERLIGKQIR